MKEAEAFFAQVAAEAIVSFLTAAADEQSSLELARLHKYPRFN
jgi:hypothetical protein